MTSMMRSGRSGAVGSKSQEKIRVLAKEAAPRMTLPLPLLRGVDPRMIVQLYWQTTVDMPNTAEAPGTDWTRVIANLDNDGINIPGEAIFLFIDVYIFLSLQGSISTSCCLWVLVKEHRRIIIITETSSYCSI